MIPCCLDTLRFSLLHQVYQQDPVLPAMLQPRTLIIDLRGKVFRSEDEFFEILYNQLPGMPSWCDRTWHAWDNALYGQICPTLDTHDLILIEVDRVGLAADIDNFKGVVDWTYDRSDECNPSRVEVRLEVETKKPRRG